MFLQPLFFDVCQPFQLTCISSRCYTFTFVPMHPKQSLAAANRYGAPLFLRKSHQRFSLPFLRLARLCFSVPPRCFAQLRLAAPCHRCSSLFIAVQCCSVALPCCALPLHSSSPHSLCHAPLSLALPLQLNAELFRCNSAPCFAKPGLAVQCLRESGPSMPCPCSQVFTS